MVQTSIFEEREKWSGAIVLAAVLHDVLEDADRSFLINEVNHTMEFHSSVPATGVDIPGKVIDYVIEQGKKREATPRPAEKVLPVLDSAQ